MVGSFVLVLYVIEIINTLMLHSLNGTFGLRPRSLDGLLDILTFPLLHANLAHLFSNTLPLIIFGFLVLLSGLRVFFTALALSWLGSGAAVWLIGGLHVTVGASGLVFGLFAFLLVRGFFNRNWWQILLSVVLFLSLRRHPVRRAAHGGGVTSPGRRTWAAQSAECSRPCFCVRPGPVPARPSGNLATNDAGPPVRGGPASFGAGSSGQVSRRTAWRR